MNDAFVHSFPGKLLAKLLNQAEKSSFDANAHEMGLVTSAPVSATGVLNPSPSRWEFQTRYLPGRHRANCKLNVLSP